MVNYGWLLIIEDLMQPQKRLVPNTTLDTILDNLHGSTIFSTLDAFSGYCQIKIRECDIEKTAFACRAGTFEFFKILNGF